MRLQKKNRLLKRSDFKGLLTEAHDGPRSKSILKLGCFRVYRNLSEAPPRLGINVARKVLKKSVDRNRVKRCVREFFRENQAGLAGDYLFKLENSPKDFSCAHLTAPLRKLVQLRENLR